MTTTLRSLRRSRGLTLTELAILSGIPARNLGAIELGMLSIDRATRAHLARVLAVSPHTLPHASPLVEPSPALIDRRQLAIPFAIALTTTALATSLLSHIELSVVSPSSASGTLPPASQAAAVIPADFPSKTAPVGKAINVTLLKAELLTATASTSAPQTMPGAASSQTATEGAAQSVKAPVATASPGPATTVESKRIDRAAPRGYPLIAPVGRIVVTQGYSEGTHTPTAVWGALDFAIDTDGDGEAEPEPTRGAPVIATHDGIVRVYPGSWPGGNFVRIENQETGWTTAYGHLDAILIRDGQEVQRGAQIGTVGSTGYATGPHLHYEIWQWGVNLDPTPFVSWR